MDVKHLNDYLMMKLMLVVFELLKVVLMFLFEMEDINMYFIINFYLNILVDVYLRNPYFSYLYFWRQKVFYYIVF